VSRERDTEQTLTPFRELPVVAERAARRGGEVELGFAPLAPRGPGEILDAALELLQGRAAVLIGVCALLWLPVRVLQPILGVQPWDAATDFDAVFGQLAGTGILALLGALVQGLSNAVVSILVFDAAQGAPIDIGAALWRALRRSFGLILIAFLTGLAAGIGILMCVLPYFFVVWKFALAPSIYVIEDGGIGDTLRRSFSLSSGTFLRWAAIMIVTVALITPFSGLVGAVDHPLVLGWLAETFRVDHTLMSVVIIVFTALFMGVVGAVGGVITTVFYIDCLVRREGRDLQARIASIVPVTPAAPGARA
jgi:hypothetical protein